MSWSNIEDAEIVKSPNRQNTLKIGVWRKHQFKPPQDRTAALGKKHSMPTSISVSFVNISVCDLLRLDPGPGRSQHYVFSRLHNLQFSQLTFLRFLPFSSLLFPRMPAYRLART